MRRLWTVAVPVPVFVLCLAMSGAGLSSAGPAGAAARAERPAVGSHLAAPGAWSIVPTPNPSPTQTNQLQSVACVSSTFCMAVGFSSGTSNPTGLITEWNGTEWSALPGPAGSPTAAYIFNGVSCTSVSFCVAVGEQQGNDGIVTLVGEWNGTAWSIVPSPNVAVPSVSQSRPFAHHPVGRSEAVPFSEAPAALTPKGPPVQSGVLEGVSCTGSSLCMAVGFATSAAGDETLAEQWNGATWSVVTTPTPSPAVSQDLEGVDCPSVEFCVAVGLSGAMGSDHPLLEQWNGSTWSPTALPRLGHQRPAQRHLVPGHLVLHGRWVCDDRHGDPERGPAVERIHLVQ